MRSHAQTAGIAAGAAAIVLIVAGFFAIDEGGTTPADGSAAQLVEELVRAPTRAGIGVAVGLVGAGLLVWFGAAVRERLSAGGGSLLGSVAFGFAVLTAEGGLLHGAFRLAATSVDDPRALGEAVRALAILGGVPMTVVVVGFIGLTLTLSAAAWVVRLLPRAMAVVGTLLAGGALAFLPDRSGRTLAAADAVGAGRRRDAPGRTEHIRNAWNGETMTATLRSWWPMAAAFAAGTASDVVFRNSFDPVGEHAAGHLMSASGFFPSLTVIFVLLWATPGARRQADVWFAAGAWAAARYVVMVGNLRVVNAINDQPWTEDEAAEFAASLPAFESGHDLAMVGAWSAVAAAILLAVVLLVRGHITPRAAIGSIALSLIVPPFLDPGAGVLVLLVVLCLARRRVIARTSGPSRHRSARAAASVGPGTAGARRCRSVLDQLERDQTGRAALKEQLAVLDGGGEPARVDHLEQRH